MASKTSLKKASPPDKILIDVGFEAHPDDPRREISQKKFSLPCSPSDDDPDLQQPNRKSDDDPVIKTVRLG
ncbi:hypothetical protein MJO29_013862 [Puccinia striiformis f. sp. tritici]|nr:hypothetical protein MJO29_013862 [Puccinia striiformis f. sp. tritici]